MKYEKSNPKKQSLKLSLLSPLRKLAYLIKLVILDEIFIFRNSMMLGHQLVEENESIAKRDFFDCVSFRSGLNHLVIKKDSQSQNEILQVRFVAYY